MRTFVKELICLTLIFATLFGCTTIEKSSAVADDTPRRIELLFLGHELEHHNSRVYMPILAASLSPQGINLTYTEDLDDLNAKNLELYDGLIIYANHENIGGTQERSFLDFVSSGKAFIPIHSASYCFKNSPKYIDLVGAQFKEHGTDTFTAKITDNTHPTMQNMEEFSTWDETYIHDKIADDITVLMERIDNDHSEPWTWIKTYGAGRVFYTAYGHDERTWNNPGFQKLITAGILWAVEDHVKENWSAFVEDIPTLKYEDRDSIPNYEKRDPPLKYQLPLSPVESAKLIQVPAGFELQLFASEPDIINPIAMNWDEKGRLWVIETVDYPNTVRDDKGLGDDRVKILEDTDNDGRADKVTVFADNLNIPTSFAFSQGGIIVSQAPQFLFLKDTDGDDIADIREVIIDGWGVFDTHAGPSNLQNGIDNNIYGVVGYSGFNGTIFGKEQKFSQGMYKFQPQKKTFEFLTNTSNNTWGLGITEDNALFASTANNTHSVFLGIPNKHLNGVIGIPAEGSLKIDGHYAMQPLTPNVRQVDVFGGFTAAAGHHFYTARNYPSTYWNKIAFVCEPTGGLVHNARIVREGAGFVEKDGGNLFASTDEWVSPVEAKTGPDGNVWVADWYNFIVQHNPTPNKDRGGYNAENGKGNAYENPLRDKSRGRIWRVVPKNSGASDIQSVDKNNPEALLKALANDNMFWRSTAQRLLVERGDSAVLKELYNIVNDEKVDAMGLNPSVLHALWTIEGLGVLDTDSEAKDVVVGALYHKSAAIRRTAIQILPRNNETDEILLKTRALYDKDPWVQLAALLYFSERTPSEAIGSLLFQLSTDTRILEDPWLSKALYTTASKHHSGFVKGFVSANPAYDLTSETKLSREDIGLDDSDWKSMELPQYIEQAGLDIDGIIWFRKSLFIADNPAGKTGIISLGPINDSDVLYINGKMIGTTQNQHTKDRYYDIPKGILSQGKNIIAIRVEDTGNKGGIYGNKQQLYLKIGTASLPLHGDWKYEVEKDFSGKAANLFEGSSMAEVLVNAYKNELLSEEMDALGGEKTANVIRVKTIKNEMKYDITEFVVAAGEQVELVLENVDFMQHNLVIIKPGQKEKVGAAADKLAADPKGAALQYVPQTTDVLFATAMVDPEQTVTLKFTAPSEPGEYPFICTFPGHWRIMQGVMKVVAN